MAEAPKTVSMIRRPQIGIHPFTEYFKGFEQVLSVKQIFMEKTVKVLGSLQIEIFSKRTGYMGVSDEDGHIFVNAEYLRDGEERGIYLDVIHELVHVKQFMEGKTLFDHRYAYVDRPTEIEAYRHAVKEARGIGATEKEIFEYLKTEWINIQDHKRLAKHVGMKLRKGQPIELDSRS
jgi:hypothetical protein|tara:strand:+ start:8218 stop:8748 length:531 start_codon:yes stop_codon:yes gene_type:complete